MPAIGSVGRTVAFLLTLIPAIACDESPEARLRRSLRVAELSGPELIPRELAAALMSAPNGPGHAGEIIVGRLPDEMPFQVPSPANSRIVGTLARPSAGTIVFAVRERPLDAVRSYRDLLRRTGWDDRARERGVGFQHPQVSYSGTFCQDDDRSISMTPAEGDGGTTYLRVFYHETTGPSVCSDSRNDDFPRRRGPMPTLYPPNDAGVLDAHGGGGMNFSESSARLKTELSPAQLVAHYAVQLRADGWTPTAEAAGKEIAGQAWRIDDRKGTPWVGVLMAFDLPDAEGREVLFRVMPPKPERYR